MAQKGIWRGGVEMKEDAMFFVRKVHDTFKRDMEQGYVTKDKQLAVDLLGQAIKTESVDAARDASSRGERMRAASELDRQTICEQHAHILTLISLNDRLRAVLTATQPESDYFDRLVALLAKASPVAASDQQWAVDCAWEICALQGEYRSERQSDSAAAHDLLKEAVRALEVYATPDRASAAVYVDGLINRIRALTQEGGR
jgi:hypothetical protein